MEVGISKGAWQTAWRYPAYLWSLRWVYADKKNPEVGIRRIPAYTSPIHHWLYGACNVVHCTHEDKWMMRKSVDKSRHTQQLQWTASHGRASRQCAQSRSLIRADVHVTSAIVLGRRAALPGPTTALRWPAVVVLSLPASISHHSAHCSLSATFNTASKHNRYRWQRGVVLSRAFQLGQKSFHSIRFSLPNRKSNKFAACTLIFK